MPFEYYYGEEWVNMGEATLLGDVYSVTFNTVGVVPDGWLDIRVCAMDDLENEDCFETAYLVQNEASSGDVAIINLQAGWNLISLPLIPYDTTIEAVLADLATHESVIQVVAWPYQMDESKIVEMRWNGGALTDLTELNDGVGYWVEMAEPDVLVFEGSPLPEPPLAPPSYVVYSGWNLIGFKSQQMTVDADTYLGEAGGDNMQVMFGFNEATGHYEQIMLDDLLMPGNGYWLAVSTNATIYPPAN